MKKQDLIDAVASKTGETKKVVATIIDSTFNTIIDSMKAGEVVDIYGFGKFESVHKEAHMGKNPMTGEEKLVEAKNNPKLRYSSAVKKAINS
jgi:DNA-binding protein HU-beta